MNTGSKMDREGSEDKVWGGGKWKESRGMRGA